MADRWLTIHRPTVRPSLGRVSVGLSESLRVLAGPGGAVAEITSLRTAAGRPSRPAASCETNAECQASPLTGRSPRRDAQRMERISLFSSGMFSVLSNVPELNRRLILCRRVTPIRAIIPLVSPAARVCGCVREGRGAIHGRW